MSDLSLALIDYGIGNLRSVEKALVAAGAEVWVTDRVDQILSAAKVVLPGVGAFGDGMAGLEARGLLPLLHEIVRRGVPLLGICLGMQLFFECSDERGQHRGLGLLPGSVTRFPQKYKVPQTGWNQIRVERPNPLLQGLLPDSYAYFNHSYFCIPAHDEDILGSTDYGLLYASVVGRGRLYGVQFHPEKSQSVGLQILKNFVECC